MLINQGISVSEALRKVFHASISNTSSPKAQIVAIKYRFKKCFELQRVDNENILRSI